MSLHKQYRKDKTTTFLRVTDVVEVQCRHFDPRGPEFINAITKITKPVRKLVEQGLLKPEQDRKYAVQAFVECCMVGWRTLVGDNEYRPEIDFSETDVEAWRPFTADNAVEIFTRYPQLYIDVTELAKELSNFQVTEAEIKNFVNV